MPDDRHDRELWGMRREISSLQDQVRDHSGYFYDMQMQRTRLESRQAFPDVLEHHLTRQRWRRKTAVLVTSASAVGASVATIAAQVIAEILRHR